MIVTPSRPAGWAWELASWIGLLLSLFLNLYLITVLIQRLSSHPDPNNKCAVARQARLQKQLAVEKMLDVSYPDESGHLSHVVIPLQNGPEALEGLRELFGQWAAYPPCLHNSYPTSWSEPTVALVLLLEADPSREFAEELRTLYREGLPAAVRACFANLEVRHAGLQAEGTMNKAAIANERLMFAQFLSNQIGLEAPSYALLVTLDCLPVQANWLNLVDYETRPPIEHYWVKGSIYRGPAENQKALDETTISNRLHLGKCALYNVGDVAFGHFYSNIVLPWLAKQPANEQLTGWQQDLPRYLFRVDHYEVSRELAALFRFSEFVQDYSETEFDPEAILKGSPATALVKGQRRRK